MILGYRFIGRLVVIRSIRAFIIIIPLERSIAPFYSDVYGVARSVIKL
jgi:hypothetical protein